MEIADERGVGAVTMREVASRLGVKAMSLYNHVANKGDILDGMIDVVVEQVNLPADAEQWREAMRCRAVSAHEVFGRHPWAPMLIDSRESSGPSRLRYFDWVLGTLINVGFSAEGAARAFSLLDSYVYGFGIQQSSTWRPLVMLRLRRWPRRSWRTSPRRTTPTCIRWHRTDGVRLRRRADFEFGLGSSSTGWSGSSSSRSRAEPRVSAVRATRTPTSFPGRP